MRKVFWEKVLINTTSGFWNTLSPSQEYSVLLPSLSSVYTISPFGTNGNNIHGIGVEPDEVYEFDSEKYYEEGYDNQLEHAKEVVRAPMRWQSYPHSLHIR